MQNIKLILSLFTLTFLSSCQPNLESRRMKFENRLKTMIGKLPTYVVNYFGRPNQYINNDVKGDSNGENGTYMIYHYTSQSIYIEDGRCDIRFRINEKSERIDDYDYQGPGCFFSMYAE